MCCKTLEHIICKHMLNHLENNKIISPLQHGFRNGHSCESQLILTMHDIMQNFDSKQQTDLVILDFSKAFDTVPHKKLLFKLSKYGITGNINKWIQSFLVLRKQQVIVEGESSKPCSVDSGVPQGSVLGPLLFLCHINDLPQRVTSKVRLFADDCLLYRPIHSPHDQLLLQQDLAALETWAEVWGMRFNVSKCYFMSIHRSKHPYSSYYKLDNHILEQVEENPYLGLTIHKSLKWASHINKISNKANSVLGFIKRNLKHTNRDLRELAYTSLVRSILEYSSTVWDPFYQKDIDRLEMVQRRAARFVLNDYKPLSSVTSMVSQLGWKPLAERRREHRLSLLYKIINGLVAIPADTHLHFNTRSTRIVIAQSVKGNDMACKRCEISTFIKDNGVDLFFVTETWLSAQGDEAKTAELAPSGFDVKSFPRQSRCRGGGIATVYKSTLGSNITLKTNFDFTHTSFEVVQASITLQHNTLHFFCLYRPPPNRRNNLTDSMFTEQLPDLLDYVNSLPGFVCLVGDMNIHFYNPLQSLTKQTLSTLSLYDLVQVINKPTHRCGHIIDWVIVRPDDDIHRKSTVTDSLESDHYCTKSYFNISVSKPSTLYRTVRNIANIDRPSFIAELSSVSEFSSVENANQFCDFLRTVLDKHAPPSLRKVITHSSSPWFESIRDQLFIAKRERRQAERKWRNTKLTIFKDLYRLAKHMVSKLVHTAKCKFYTERTALASSSKELHQIVNTLSNRHPPKILPTIYPSADLPSIFIKHFTNKVEKLRANIASEHVTSTLVTGTTAATFSSFEKVSQLTVKECILNSAPKSCELDPIPSKLLIECLDSILPSLIDLFNSSLASGIFPQCFKSALVTPILKKRCLDHNDLNNYRPVSNLCFIAKILEKLVLSQVSSYLNSHILYNTCQSAYRPGHSTETALLKVVNDLFLSLNKGNISVLALLDFSSAFDTIDHTILVHRLHIDFGFTDTVLQWFSSYLTDRTHYVSLCNHHSDFAPVYSGVPQGSVLGPILFTMYIKPLSAVIDSHSIIHHSFADDLQLQMSAPPDRISELLHSMQSCICDVKAWATVNMLRLNDSKTELMLVTSKRSKHLHNLPTSITIGNA